LAALDQCDYRAEPDDLAEIDRTLRGEVEHGLRVLFVKEDIGDDESLTHLHEALDYEFEQVHRRVFLLLSFVYDSQVILRAEEQLVGGSKGEQALAMETLDVTLSGEQKALVFPLVDHSKPLVERARQLDKLFTLRHISRHQRLNEIITDPEGVWTHGWTRACAIYAAAKLGVAESVEVIEEALSIREHPIRETAAWALYTLAPERYQAHAAELATDVNPQVAQLAATLA
jgi:HEAT repeat protein